jgi:hypothetical protein
VGAQSRQIGGSDNSEVKILNEMMRDTLAPSSQAVHMGQALVCLFPNMK